MPEERAVPVCITGMHRSGTSMVARSLEACGLSLGRQDDLLEPAADNPDGFWEHAGIVQINEAILNHFGGGWDWPPRVPPDWNDKGADYLAGRAREIVAQFAGEEPWGWKDPRNSLTMPFWQHVCPDLRTILVVRNPLEVALSLSRRNSSSLAQGLALWFLYGRRVLDSVPPGRRITTHYDAFFQDAASELARLCAFTGLDADKTTLRDAVVVQTDRRHSRYTWHHLEEAHVSPEIIELYRELCDEAGWEDEGAASTLHGVEEVVPLGEGSEYSISLTGTVGRLDRTFLLEGTIRTLEDKLEDCTQWAHRQRGEIAAREETIARLREEMAHKAVQLDTLLTAVDRLTGAAELVHHLPHRIRRAAGASVPAGARIAVISRGEQGLVQFQHHHASHFPSGEEGTYAGFYPRDSNAAILHLEELRARGLEYFLIPSPALWWLDHYTEFQLHLDSRYRRVWSDQDCVIYDLAEEA